MDEIFNTEQQKKGISMTLIGGIIVGLVLIGGAIWMLSFKPSIEDRTAQIVADAYREGSPEFAELSKNIQIATDESTVESPMGLGSVSMFIKGNIYNRNAKNITTLEVNVGVVTQENVVLREKKIVVVPIQHRSLPAGGSIPITLTLDGFDRKDDRANIRWKVTAVRAE